MPAAPHATEVLAAIDKLEKFVDGSNFMPAERYYRSAVLLALISKALTVGRAVCALVRAGFPGEAFGLSRTVVEIFFIVRWIANKDTEARAERYVKYFAKAHEGWTKIIQKHYPERQATPMPSFHDEAMDMAKEYKSRHNWTDLPGQVKVMALEGDTREVDANGEPVKCEFDYEAVYWWTSQFVHATVLSLKGHGVPPGSVFHVRPMMEAEHNRGHDALFNVVTYLSNIFVCALRAMNIDQPEELTEIGVLVHSFARSAVSSSTAGDA